MKAKFFYRAISVLLCLLTVIGVMSVSLTAGAAVLPDDYENDYENITYQDLGILEDQYDLIEPVNNLFPIISPNSKYDMYFPYFIKGSCQYVENELKNRGMTDGMSVVPPTKIKAEKFLGYSSYGFTDKVARIDGRDVKAYMVAANAIMAGCSPELTPFCIAFTQALENQDYLDSLRSGQLTPMMYVNGPACHQIGIDNTQGMTTEESNIALGRFMELALINFTDIDRTNAFGNVQPLVFSENDETCLKIGWTPHHVEKGFDLNDNIITASSFAMWGNNVTPATDLPEEIMKVLAWDITEKNLGGLGGASVEANADTHRLIFITESVATALATKYKSKEALEGALIENARRPLWMRAYAYYYANTGSALTKSFSEIYSYIGEKEGAKSTASPPWMNGITYAEIDTVPTMTKGNTDIIVTGDSSRNKTQVMPGGVSVNAEVRLSDSWDRLVQSVNFFPYEDFELDPINDTITPPASVPSVLTNGAYRILDPQTGASNLTRAGRVYYDSDTGTLYYYAQGASSAASVALDPVADAAFISYLNNLGYNSSFTVNNGKFTAVVIRFSSNASKLNNNTVALTDDSFDGMSLTLHANHFSPSENASAANLAGGVAKDGATVDIADTVTSYTVNLDDTVVMGDKTNADFVKLNGTTVTVDPTVEAGATAVIGASNGNGTYRTMTFVNTGDGTYKVIYNTTGTLSLTASSVYLKGTFNNWSEADAFAKTANGDIISVTKELAAGSYEFKIHKFGTDEWYGKDETIADSAYRIALNKSSDTANIKLNATGGKYEFKYELSTNKLSVYYAAEELPVIVTPTEPPTQAPTDAPDTEIIKRHSITLGGDIGVNFYLDLSAEELAQGVRVDFAWNGKSDSVTFDSNSAPETKPGAEGLYKATCYVCAAEMNDEITVSVTVGDSTEPIATETYKVRDYADVILENKDGKFSDALIALVKTMLNYGAAAQNQFSHNTDALANAEIGYKLVSLSEAEINGITGDVPDKAAINALLTESGIEYYGYSLILKTKTTLRFYFKKNGADTSQLALLNGDNQNIGTVKDYNDAYCYIEIEGIPAYELSDCYELKYGDISLGSFSALSYVKDVLKNDNGAQPITDTVTALYRYNEAAKYFFGHPTPGQEETEIRPGN